jgi:hypothetical protein
VIDAMTKQQKKPRESRVDKSVHGSRATVTRNL